MPPLSHTKVSLYCTNNKANLPSSNLQFFFEELTTGVDKCQAKKFFLQAKLQRENFFPGQQKPLT